MCGDKQKLFLSSRLYTNWQEKKTKYYMHLITKQDEHFYLGKKKPNSLSTHGVFNCKKYI